MLLTLGFAVSRGIVRPRKYWPTYNEKLLIQEIFQLQFCIKCHMKTVFERYLSLSYDILYKVEVEISPKLITFKHACGNVVSFKKEKKNQS